ncbi:hypothetical protein Vadar_013327 [Vaccinium darrowii]|uniref:Uncharacterized protein n=1 Tax=Vaccinium darrowii TaxID=229202 RepID=A0ACB7XH80_9ERIC|nr:hypothetical protein Vadar_013327 [Vaccinium darrowii]
MWIFGRKSPSGFSASSTAEEVTQGIDGTGLTAIVTGASSGLGKETACVLALRGVMSPFTLTKDNIELNFGTNHIGHFLLTNLLLETMKSTARESQKEGRIVNVSSLVHNYTYPEGIRFDKINDESGFGTWSAYGQSKLANILHANELARRFKEEGVNITCNSLHPGVVATNLLPHHSPISGLVIGVLKYLMKNIPQGAATACYVALHPQVKGVSGEYFSDCNIAERSALAKDEELAKKLWDFSLNLTDTN